MPNLKKSLLLVIFTLIMGISMSGCSTWHGLKKDTGKVWDVATS